MLSREISLDTPPAKPAHCASGLDRRALIPVIVGLLTAASILLLIYQENRSVQYQIEATEAWSAYQVKSRLRGTKDAEAIVQPVAQETL